MHERHRRPDGISAVRGASLPGYGSEWKKEIKSRYVAQARVWIAGGEMLAQKENFVELDPEVKDHWGIPVLKIHFTHCDNDWKIIADFQQKAEELFRKAGGEIMPGFGAWRSGWISRWTGLARYQYAGRSRSERAQRRRRPAARSRQFDPRSRNRAHERKFRKTACSIRIARRTISRICTCSAAMLFLLRATSIRP